MIECRLEIIVRGDLMSFQYESVTNTDSRKNTRTKRPSVKIVLLTWFLLIAIGVTSAYLYSNYLKTSMLQQLDATWQQRIGDMQNDYTTQLSTLSNEVKDLQSKVDSFNELLEFTKDNKTDESDSSNKLYTQLSEVQKQLTKLQSQMDLLK
ncbi:hypothetical protein D3C78_1466680 [compost metagenome]